VAGKGKVWGAQFHPEKSSSAGLRMLTNFMEICS
jgi:imidazoleglycerol phosphate synthase glutamine amidotransferase subunit HisH